MLTEYEKEHTKVDQSLGRKSKGTQFKYEFDRYEYTAFFDGACTRKLKYKAIGVYSWVLFDRQGMEIAK